MKRSRIEQWIMNKDYSLLPEGAQLLFFSAEPRKVFVAEYAPKPRTKINHGTFKVESFDIKGLKAQGVRLSPRDIVGVRTPAAPSLFDEDTEPVAEDLGTPAGKAMKAMKTEGRVQSTKSAKVAKEGKSPKDSVAGKTAKTGKTTKATKETKARDAKAKEAKAKEAKAAQQEPRKPRGRPKKDDGPGESKKPAGGLLSKASAKKKPE